MIVGIGLIVIAALGASGLAALIAGSPLDGGVEIAAIGVAGRGGLALLVIATAVTTGAVLGAVYVIAGRRRRVAYGGYLDARAAQAGEEARARLLAMRLAVLQREVEGIELRREAVEAPEKPPARRRRRTKRDEGLVVLPNAR